MREKKRHAHAVQARNVRTIGHYKLLSLPLLGNRLLPFETHYQRERVAARREAALATIQRFLHDRINANQAIQVSSWLSRVRLTKSWRPPRRNFTVYDGASDGEPR